MRGSSRLWGVLLVCAGVLFLLQNLGMITIGGGLLIGALFGIAGLAFLVVFGASRANWWAVIPGMTLLGLAGLVEAGSLYPHLTETWGGAFFLGCIGASFWIVFFREQENWWAIIPGGALLTLALIAGMAGRGGGIEVGGVLFLGLAATFGVVYFLPTPEGRMRWAIFPAAILGGMGLLFMIAAVHLFDYIWAIALIVAGTLLIARNLQTREM